MEFDFNKLNLSKREFDKSIFTDNEVEFMSNIYNYIINFEDYDVAMSYLAGIHSVSILQIEQIRKIYYNYFASKEEKIIYSNKIKEINNLRRKEGFVDFSVVISFTTFLFGLGITLALILYNNY